jgi:hypothetical protein
MTAVDPGTDMRLPALAKCALGRCSGIICRAAIADATHGDNTLGEVLRVSA